MYLLDEFDCICLDYSGSCYESTSIEKVLLFGDTHTSQFSGKKGIAAKDG